MKNTIADSFDEYVQWVLFAEGQYSNDEADRGGKTHWGLSDRFLSSIDYVGAAPTREGAIAIYRQYFWNGYRCDEMHPFVAWCACDAYIQHPPKAAAMMLQQGLGVDIDGSVGPQTMKAAQSPNLLMFWRRYRLARVRYYNDIVANDDSQQVFIDGWHNRVHKLTEGMFFAGLIRKDETGNGLAKAITSPTAKATTAGVTIGGIVVALQSIGVDTQNVIEWAEKTLPAGGLIGLAVTWLAKTNFTEKN